LTHDDENYTYEITEKGRTVLKEVYRLFQDGYSVEEIAEMLNMDADSVRLFVAMDVLGSDYILREYE
jgi:DNA-binding PadR family transcriptional regulator